MFFGESTISSKMAGVFWEANPKRPNSGTDSCVGLRE